MNSDPSASDERGGAGRSSVSKLDERIQRWIWKRGWAELRGIQQAAIDPILAADRDVILAAATAGGKTEAAFLPILTHVLKERRASIEVLYVGPLKALINDQFERLDLLCQDLGIAVHRWHGDVAAARKRAVLDDPSGVLLITPESLDAFFVLRGPRVSPLFQHLAYVVVDELHAYPGSERGRQLQSLLHRLELVLRRRVPRIGLSATLGDMSLAKEFLRPGEPTRVEVLNSGAGPAEIQLLVKGYEARAPKVRPKGQGAEDEKGESDEDVALAQEAIARHLYENLRGSHHLVFANRRSDVEAYADRLRLLCERAGVPVEFWPHHGSLSKELREDVERRLKDRSLPTTVVCTSTLEMGIDIGSVASIAQVGAPPSVASLRQRLGRSGRRDAPAVMRLYVTEPAITPQTPVLDQLRSQLIQSVAMLNLLLERWCEPPTPAALHLSTLVQQTLSLIAQHGSVSARDAYRALCQSGPFRAVDSDLFAEVLHSLGHHDLIAQMGDQSLTLGVGGERLVGHYSFYTAFQTPEEWTLVAGERTLGSLPLLVPLLIGDHLIFAGRRWRVMDVDPDRHQIRVAAGRGGRAPGFTGEGALVHDRVRAEMRRIYASSEVPAFLDETGRRFLAEGRDTFRRLGLLEQHLLEHGREVLLFPWAGDRTVHTLVLQLKDRGVDAVSDGLAITIAGAEPEQIREILTALAAAGPPDGNRLAAQVLNKQREKHDRFLPEDALIADYGAKCLDPNGAHAALRRLF